MSAPNTGQIAQKGQEIYDRKLKDLLEPEQNGMFVAIEPESEDYFLGKSMSEARQSAHNVHPNKTFFLIRIGFKAAVSFKHRNAS